MKNSRTAKACQECGAMYYGSPDCHYCPDCARKKKLDTVVRIRVCQDCGAKFFGGPRAKRCPPCADAATKIARKIRGNRPASRPLGSVDVCKMCGKEYIVNGGRQMYCPDCARAASLAWQREHKKGYNKISGQDIKKQERRKAQQKICIYCQRKFKSSDPTNLCSPHCKIEHKRLQMSLYDIKRRGKSGYDRLVDLRRQYREAVKNNADLSGYSGSKRIDYKKYIDSDLAALTPGEQKALNAKIQNPDMTTKELADLCGLKEKSVNTLLSRSIKKINDKQD